MLKIPGIQSKEKNNFKKRQNIENSSSADPFVVWVIQSLAR